MEGMLSQDEINALLSGMDLTAETDNKNEAIENEAILAGVTEVLELSDVEKDAIGEVANISMGSSATNLYTLVNRKVNITTPTVEVAKWNTLLDEYEESCVFIQIKYTVGLDGTNILVLRKNDVMIIADLMMGGDGTNTEGELTEMHISAISEAMNQMMGAAVTSISTMLGIVIDISPPESLDADKIAEVSGRTPFLSGSFVKISFRMQIGDLVDSNIMQLYPVEFARKIVETFIDTQMPSKSIETEKIAESSVQVQEEPQMGMSGMDMSQQMGMPGMGMPGMDMSQQMGMPGMGMPQMGMPGMDMSQQMGMPQMGMPGMDMSQQMGMPGMGMPQMGMPQMGMPQMGMPQMGMPQMGMPQMGMQNIHPAQFQNFAGDVAAMIGKENIGLIMDVPLEVTVELGRTSKSISDILEFSPGTIIELDRIAGEPIDVLVNGKFVAKGEVVVIEESFGIRVTEIIK